MKQSKETPLFKDFMASSIVVKYPCNKHACENKTDPKMITQKDLAHILSLRHSNTVSKNNSR